jgi:hypothetical protein
VAPFCSPTLARAMKGHAEGEGKEMSGEASADAESERGVPSCEDNMSTLRISLLTSTDRGSGSSGDVGLRLEAGLSIGSRMIGDERPSEMGEGGGCAPSEPVEVSAEAGLGADAPLPSTKSHSYRSTSL